MPRIRTVQRPPLRRQAVLGRVVVLEREAVAVLGRVVVLERQAVLRRLACLCLQQ